MVSFIFVVYIQGRSFNPSIYSKIVPFNNGFKIKMIATILITLIVYVVV